MSITDKDCASLNNVLMNSNTLDLIREKIKNLGFELLEVSGDPGIPGFLGATFKKIGENELVIAHRGTAPRWCKSSKLEEVARCPKVFGKDIKDDLRVMRDEIPKQMHRSESLLEHAKSKYPGHNIALTGFSLGGVYAELLGLKEGLRVVSFDAPGIKSLVVANYGSAVLEKNKHLVTQYKTAPNLINTFGEHYTDKNIQIVFEVSVSETWGFGYIDYTERGHNIELMEEHFKSQRDVGYWPSGLFEGYKHYLLLQGAKIYGDKHKLSSIYKDEFERKMQVLYDKIARALDDDVLDLEEYAKVELSSKEAEIVDAIRSMEEQVDFDETTEEDASETNLGPLGANKAINKLVSGLLSDPEKLRQYQEESLRMAFEGLSQVEREMPDTMAAAAARAARNVTQEQMELNSWVQNLVARPHSSSERDAARAAAQSMDDYTAAYVDSSEGQDTLRWAMELTAASGAMVFNAMGDVSSAASMPSESDLDPLKFLSGIANTFKGPDGSS